MKALRHETVDCTPVWFMRQAGRVLPEYREVRERLTLLEICARPEVCAEVTLQPVDRLGVDAAIIFADIMTPLIGIGVDIDIVDGVGPVLQHPIRTREQLHQLRALEPEADVTALLESVRLVSSELERGAKIPLLGFAGAPYTLASYLIEGRSSRDFAETKRFMYSTPEMWHDMMTRLAEIVGVYLVAQVEAGAQAVQLFDSWAGALSESDYVRFVKPYTSTALKRATEIGVPVINFSTGTAGFLEQVAQAGGSTVGVDWRVPLDKAWGMIAKDQGMQGNLDPLALLGPKEYFESATHDVLRRASGRSGHVFNLGHGVHPETHADNLRRLVDIVHEYPIVAS